MICEWCCRARETLDAVPLPATKPKTDTLAQRKQPRLPQLLPAKKPVNEDTLSGAAEHTGTTQEEPSKTPLGPAAEDTSPEQEQTVPQISYYTTSKQEQRVTNVL